MKLFWPNKLGELAWPKMLPVPKADWDCGVPKPGALCCANRPPLKGLAACCPKMLPVCPKAGVEACPNAPPEPNRDGALACPKAPPVLKLNGEEGAALLAAKGCPKPGEDCACPNIDPPVPKEDVVEPKAGVEAPKRLGADAAPKTLAADDCPNAPAKDVLPNAAPVCRAQPCHDRCTIAAIVQEAQTFTAY